MSLTYNEQKSYRNLLYLKMISNQGHFKNYSKGIDFNLDRLMNFYENKGIKESTIDKIRISFYRIENKFDDAGILGKLSDSIMLLSLCICLCEQILGKTKQTVLRTLYEAFLDYCNDSLPKNFDKYTESIVLSETIAEILINEPN